MSTSESILSSVVPLLVALFNLLVAGYALAAGARARSRLAFAVGPGGVGLWALAWFISVFQTTPSMEVRWLGTCGATISMAGFFLDSLSALSPRAARLLVAGTVAMGAGLGAAAVYMSGERQGVEMFLHASRPLGVALALGTVVGQGLHARASRGEQRKVPLQLAAAGVGALLVSVFFALTTLVTERALVDPLLFVVLTAELYALVYIVRGLVSVQVLLSRAVTYAALSLVVAVGAAFAFAQLGYPVDPVIVAATVAISLAASAMFMGVADRMSKSVERALFPRQARLEKALLASKGELLALRRRLERAEKLAIAGELAASVAHEIKNPLSPIKGYAQLLSSKLAGVQEAERPLFEKGLAIIKEETERIDKRIHELLSAARVDKTRASSEERCELVRVLEEAILVAEGESSGRIVRSFEEGLPLVCGNEDEMRGAFLNLVKNALEAMQGDGQGEVEVSCRREGARVVVEVLDEGPGLPAEQAERAFEAFYTTKQGGTGLGLAIARSAVDAAGGRIRLEARPNRRGAVARVELLVVDGEGPAAEVAAVSEVRG